VIMTEYSFEQHPSHAPTRRIDECLHAKSGFKMSFWCVFYHNIEIVASKEQADVCIIQ